MEDSVPGKLEKKTDQSKKFCGPCKEDNKYKGAEGFCIDCQDYLCENCFRCHCIPKPTKHHRVLDKNDMPKRKVVRKFSEVCQKHKGETFKYFCKDHDVIGCYSCIYPEHETCTETCSLEDAVCGTESSPLYIDFFNRVSELEKEFEKEAEQAKRNCVDIFLCHSIAVAEMERAQDEVNDFFKKLSQKATEMYSDHTDKVLNIQKEAESAKEDLHHLKEDLQLLEQTKQNKQLFMVINQEKENQKNLKERIKSLKLDNNVKSFNFIPNPKLETLIKDLGKLSMEP